MGLILGQHFGRMKRFRQCKKEKWERGKMEITDNEQSVRPCHKMSFFPFPPFPFFLFYTGVRSAELLLIGN